MAHRALLLLDDNKIVSCRLASRVLPVSFVFNRLSHHCNLVEGGKGFDHLKLFGRIRALMVELGAYGSG